MDSIRKRVEYSKIILSFTCAPFDPVKHFAVNLILQIIEWALFINFSYLQDVNWSRTTSTSKAFVNLVAVRLGAQ